MNIQTLKGFRDFMPADARKRQFVVNKLRSVFESYGFEPLETPALEYEEILMGKYGEEGDKLMYRFEDNGGRRVALRYDQTVPLARVVAQYSNSLPFPFKRYQMQNVWRAENTQKGRYREFLQCDIDTVGMESVAADAEIVATVNKAMEMLGFKDFKILINDRRVFTDLPPSAIVSIDKLKKIGEDGVREELSKKGFDPNILTKIKDAEPVDELRMIIEIAQRMGVDKKKMQFFPTLARGLDYYTGMILEVEVEGFSAGSVCGGGRYDNLIGMFTKTPNLPAGRQVPAVGVAFGFDRIIEAMDEQNLFPQSVEEAAQVLVTVFGPDLMENSIKVCSRLRSNNISTELWLDAESKMEKQLKYADTKGIPFVIIIGPEEKEKNTVTLRDMKTREQKQLKLEELLSLLSNS